MSSACQEKDTYSEIKDQGRIEEKRKRREWSERGQQDGFIDALWRSGFASVPAGFMTYLSNALES